MIEVNLLPERQKRRGGRGKASSKKGARLKGVGKDRDTWSMVLVAVGVFIPLGMAVLWWGQRSVASELEARLEVATADSARLADLRAVSDSLSARRQLIRERVALVEQLDRNRFVWPHMLDEISRALPQLAWLTNLRQISPLPSATVQIQGLAANPLAITEYVRNLEASTFVSEVRILGSQKQTLEDDLVVQAFTLTARYAPPMDQFRTEPIVSIQRFSNEGS
jgi:type IV pilus assembly protein PilN